MKRLLDHMDSSLTPAKVIEHIMTSSRPGSRPPDNVAWAVFGNGTIFFTEPDDQLLVTATIDDVRAAALASLQELSAVAPGSSAGDFGVARLDGWYPDDPVYWVSYSLPDMTTYPTVATIVVKDVDSDISAGLLGRQDRQADYLDPAIVSVRTFDGSKWSESPAS